MVSKIYVTICSQCYNITIKCRKVLAFGLAPNQMNNKISSGVQMELIPVNLLTGFLGSGKSTLLTEILQDPKFCNTAVVVNEFGEIGLDGLLIEHTNDQIVEMTSGCLCCTIRGDIRQTLVDLYGKCVKGQIPKFDRVVVESTGLADPVPVVQTLMSDPLLRNRYMLGGVIATIDALHGVDTIERHKECEKQVALADRLVITKSDLIAGNTTKKHSANCKLNCCRSTQPPLFWTDIKEILSLKVCLTLPFMTQNQSQ